MRILSLDGNLGYGIIVHANGHALHLGIIVSCIFGIAGVWVILLVATEEIEVRGGGREVREQREDVVASLNAYGVCILADEGRVVIRRLLVSTVINILQLFGIAQIAIVGLSANNPVVSIVGKIKGTNKHLTFILRIHTIGISGVAVADALAVIATQAQT